MLLIVSDKEPAMKDNRTVRRTFVKRVEAERQWYSLYRLLLELGSRHLPNEVTANDWAAAPSFPTEVSYEGSRLCPRVDPTPSRGANDHPTTRPPAGPRADRGLDDYAPTSLILLCQNR